ncbi:MAG: putative sugar O-methyltransferase [Nocardioidaceae bacterium]|nr:putative sugar O-methyltransferase [Nocardioidaceae bacterium]
MTDWGDFNVRMLRAVTECDPVYRPTNFRTPGLRDLLADLEKHGLDSFKSWPSAGVWFYPRYGLGLRPRAAAQVVEWARQLDDTLPRRRMNRALNGLPEAHRDFDAVRLAWDQSRWPYDLDGVGESDVGRPRQHLALTGPTGPRWTKPYLNYLLCLAALSRHVSSPPTSFVEIGGGFGVLGEIVLQRDPGARYVNVDIPPLLTVASFYLSQLFGSARVRCADDVPASGPVELSGSACLPNWRVADLRGDYDAFVNSFSFQEMEPPVVQHYVDTVGALGVEYAVSLNSRSGKRQAVNGEEGGVLDPVTSDRIVAMFERHGYQVQGRYGPPLIRSAGELVVLRRTR